MASSDVRVVKAYTRQDGRWWHVSLPDLGTSGQARTLDEAPKVAREIAALWLDVDEASLRIELVSE
jgi:predicted RNase H-like HicB family nuclease